MNIAAIIQARMGSIRLPGKVMKPILGKPVLWHVVNRILQSKLVGGNIILAITVKPEDDIIESFCKKNNIKCFRGSEEDVLDRYYRCARKYDIKNIVRITADCPLIDPDIIDSVVNNYFESNVDYCSNTLEETFPDGEDVEIFTFKSLKKVWENSKLLSEREHVTPYYCKHAGLFRIKNVSYKKDARCWTELKQLRLCTCVDI